MARIRSIKPELPQDAKLARLSRGTRYHFVLLWLVADDEGYFRASPRLLLGQLYPHDRDLGEAAVDGMTAELRDGGFIEVQMTADGPLGHIVNWSKHQRIDKPSKSHLAPLFASASRGSREGVAPRSPESGVLSLDHSASNEAGAEPRPDSTPTPERHDHRDYSVAMGALRQFGYKGGTPTDRDGKILRDWIRSGKHSGPEIASAFEGLRLATEAGKTWLKPGEQFTARALINTRSGDLSTWEEAMRAIRDKDSSGERTSGLVGVGKLLGGPTA
jgi:hypothetical protein